MLRLRLDRLRDSVDQQPRSHTTGVSTSWKVERKGIGGEAVAETLTRSPSRTLKRYSTMILTLIERSLLRAFRGACMPESPFHWRAGTLLLIYADGTTARFLIRTRL